MGFRELFSNKNIALSLISIFLASFSFGVLIPILPFYSLEFGASPLDIGIITGLWAAMGLIFSPLLGGITDKVGKKRVLVAGMFAYVLVYSLYAMADRLFIVYVARAMEGLIAAAIFPAAVSLISDLSSEKNRNQAITLAAVSFSLGFIFGPAFGGLAAAQDISNAFWLATVLTVINGFLLAMFLKVPKQTKKSEEYLLEKEISLLGHLKGELKLLFVNTFMATFLIGSLEATFALYTMTKLGFQATDVGFTFALVGIMVFFSQLISGKIVKFIGEKKMIIIGLAVSAVGFLALFFVTNYPMVLLALFLMVLGNAFLLPTNISLITKKAVGSQKGAILGLNNSFQSLGQLVGPVLAGFFYSIKPFFAFVAVSGTLLFYLLIYALKTKE